MRRLQSSNGTHLGATVVTTEHNNIMGCHVEIWEGALLRYS